MSQKKHSEFPTGSKKFTITETNAYIPHLEKSFMRLRQLNDSVNNILYDLGIETSDLAELDLLKHTESMSEETYVILTDLKLYLSAIQDTVRGLSKAGCLIDNLDQGKVIWSALHEEDNNAEILWSFGEKQCRLITSDNQLPNDIYLVPDQMPTGESRFNEE